MKLRAFLVTFALMLLCVRAHVAFSLQQDQSTQPNQTQTQEAPKQPDQSQPEQQTPSQEQTQQPDQAPRQNPTSPPEQSSPAPAQVTPPAIEPNPPEAQPTPAPKTMAPTQQAGAPPKPPVLRHKKRTTASKKKTSSGTAQKAEAGSGTQHPETEPSKVVVRNGGVKDESAQLAPAVTPAQAQHERISTAQLLALTDANLKKVTIRQLTSAEQGTLGEIRTYVRQAKAASAAGDTNRAQTLAYKARLLSDELARK